MRKRDLFNSSGMGLLEVMIVVGIVAISGAAISSLVVMGLKSTKHIQQKSEVNEFSGTLNLAFLDGRICGAALNNGLTTNSFTSANFAASDLTSIQLCDPATGTGCSMLINMASSTTAFQSGLEATRLQILPAAGGGANLGNISINSPAWSATPGVPVIYRRYLARVEVDVRKVDPGSSVGSQGFRTLVKEMILMVNDSDNRAEMCYGFESPEYACRNLLGGDWDAMETPACQLRFNNINSNNQYASDFTNVNAYSLSLGERTAGGSSNVVLYGDRPGITFGDDSGASPNVLPPPLDSGSAALFWDSATGRLIVRSPPNGGTLELNSGTGATTGFEVWSGSLLAMRVPNAGTEVRFHRNINATGHTVTASNVINLSDRRLKTSIRPLESSLDKVLRLEGVQYRYTSDPDRVQQSGYIAQDVAKVVPSAIHKTDKGFLGIDYSSLIAYLSEAIKELKEIFDLKAAEQDQRLDKMEQQIAELQAQLRQCQLREPANSAQ